MPNLNLDTHGLTWLEELKDFISFYNDAVSQTNNPAGLTLTVVHGYGSNGAGGIVRKRLRGFMARKTQFLEFPPGEDIDGNQGCTLVQPIGPLPGMDDMLAEEIWEFCELPRSKSKIFGKFRFHGDPKVQNALNNLEMEGRITKHQKGKNIVYQEVPPSEPETPLNII